MAAAMFPVKPLEDRFLVTKKHIQSVNDYNNYQRLKNKCV